MSNANLKIICIFAADTIDIKERPQSMGAMPS